MSEKESLLRLKWPARLDLPLAGGLALLLGGLLLWSLHDWPGMALSLVPQTDMGVYIRHAAGLADGTWPGNTSFYRAPLYSFFLWPFINHPMLISCMAQALLYAGTVMLSMATASQLGGRRAGWIAALMLCGYGGAFYWISILHSTVLEMFLCALLMWILVDWQQHLRAARADSLFGGRRFVIRAVAGGLCFALLCLVRPNFLVLAPVMVFCFLRFAPTKTLRKPIMLQGVLAVVATLALFAPVLIHNNRHSDTPVFLSTNGGKTFRDANAEGAAIFSFTGSSDQMMPLTSGRFWWHQAKKLVAYWWSPEYPQNVNFYLFRDASWVLKLLFLPFGLFGALTVVGSLVLWKRRSEAWPLYALFFTYYLTVVAFYVIGRYRVPVVAPMAVMGAVSLMELWRMWKGRHPIRALYLLIAMGSLTLFSCPWMTVCFPRDLYNLGMACMRQNKPQHALPIFQRAVKMDRNWDNRMQLAITLTVQQQDLLSFCVLDGLRRDFPRHRDIHETCAGALERSGESIAKIAYIQKEDPDKGAGQDLIVEGIGYFIQQLPLWDTRKSLRTLIHLQDGKGQKP